MNNDIDKSKILVVDDQEIVRNLLTRILEREGYQVQSASDGHAAIQMAQIQKFHLFMVDIKMPGMSGVEVIKKIKEIDHDAQIVMITGHASLETAIDAIRNGACDYITKPFDSIEYVINVINRAVEKRRLIDENKRRIFELNVLYKVSNAISNIFDYRELLEATMDSINRLIDCDSCASILVSNRTADFVFKSPYPVTLEFVQQVKSNLIQAFNTLADVPITEEYVISSNEDSLACDTSATTPSTKITSDGNSRLKSVSAFFNVPLIIRGKPVGMINSSSTKRDALSEYDIQLLYTIANQTVTAIDRLRAIAAAEKNKIETMVESMSDGVIMIDEKGELAIINPAARKMLAILIDDRQFAELIAKPKVNIEKTDTIAAFGLLEYLRISLTEGKKQNQEIVIKSPQLKGESVGEQSENTILQANIAPVETSEGKKLGAVAVLRDITREKEIDRMKSDFISIVSHELRTPLANTKNAVSLIEISGELNDNQKKFISIAIRNSDRLARLIEQLLDISRIESGRAELNIEMVSIEELVSDSIESLKHQAEEKSISIIDNIPEDLPNIEADKDRLKQVFLNLIDNAIKYTDKGGKVKIEAKYISVIDGKGDDFVEVRVIDTGIGIAPKNHERIFDKFQQVDTSYSPRKTGGVGLGLTIVKEIIEKHHGKIWVESQLGEGSQFIFVLPTRKNGKWKVNQCKFQG